MDQTAKNEAEGLPMEIKRIDHESEFPSWLNLQQFAEFMHESLKPYEDTVPDILSGVRYALSGDADKGGYVILGISGDKPLGAVVMLDTHMKGYIPSTLLLFVAVDPSMRGKGLGRKLIEKALSEAPSDVKLHVEYENPAKRLYERIGFTTKYAEMRYHK
ncbi:MAG: GNAT family N-acetyltransferase [Acidobacteriota bacterium]